MCYKLSIFVVVAVFERFFLMYQHYHEQIISHARDTTSAKVVAEFFKVKNNDQ